MILNPAVAFVFLPCLDPKLSFVRNNCMFENTCTFESWNSHLPQWAEETTRKNISLLIADASTRSETKKTRLLALSFGLSLAAGLVYCGQHNGGAEIPKEDNNRQLRHLWLFTFNWITLDILRCFLNLMFDYLYWWYRSSSHLDSLHF